MQNKLLLPLTLTAIKMSPHCKNLDQQNHQERDNWCQEHHLQPVENFKYYVSIIENPQVKVYSRVPSPCHLKIRGQQHSVVASI